MIFNDAYNISVVLNLCSKIKFGVIIRYKNTQSPETSQVYYELMAELTRKNLPKKNMPSNWAEEGKNKY